MIKLIIALILIGLLGVVLGFVLNKAFFIIEIISFIMIIAFIVFAFIRINEHEQ